jgi:hypothetical protein
MLLVLILAGGFLETFAQQETEQGIALSLRRAYFRMRVFAKNNMGTNRVKPGDTWILKNFQELKDFFGEDKASRFAKVVDFDKEVVVVVVSDLLDSCKRTGISALERIQEDRIKVTVETFQGESCKPAPADTPYTLLGTHIERPVTAVEVVYISKIVETPEFLKKEIEGEH